jgi:Flp pilus assembly pilin Flp
MKRLPQQLISLLRDEDAVTSVEYAVVLGLILMVIAGSIGTLGSQTDGMWGRICGDMRRVGFVK